MHILHYGDVGDRLLVGERVYFSDRRLFRAVCPRRRRGGRLQRHHGLHHGSRELGGDGGQQRDLGGHPDRRVDGPLVEGGRLRGDGVRELPADLVLAQRACVVEVPGIAFPEIIRLC